MRKFGLYTLVLLAMALPACKVLEEVTRHASDLSSTKQNQAPSQSEVSEAIKQALKQGISKAISDLGRENGFYLDPKARVPLPDDLLKVERFVRSIGQGRYVDEFVITLNRAAEKAVPDGLDIFFQVISQMSISDAVGIIKGGDRAATDYFRAKSETVL